MAILQASASLSGGSSLVAAATWIDVDSGPELLSGAGTIVGKTTWIDVDSGSEFLYGWGGLIAKASWVDIDQGPELLLGGGPSNPRTNLIAWSNNFVNSPWLNNGIIPTSGFPDPFGGNTAWSIVEDTSLGQEHRLTYPAAGTVPGGTYTYSFYLLGGLGKNYISLRAFSNPNNSCFAWVRFNLALNNFDQDTVGGGATHSYTAKALPGGWWYITHTFSFPTTDTGFHTRIELLSGDGTTNTPVYDGDGHTGVYVCDAQLEAGSIATSYIPTSGSPLLVYGGSALVTSASRLTYATAQFSGGGNFIASSVSYRAFLQGSGTLTVSTTQREESPAVFIGGSSLIVSPPLLVSAGALLSGSGSVTSGSWLLAVRKSGTPASGEPEMSTNELVEANNIAQQILASLMGASNLRSGTQGPLAASAIRDLQANASELLEDQVFAAPFLNCFDQVRQAAATYESMDLVRQLAAGLSPVFPTSQWVANIAVSFALIEQAQILAAMQFTCRSQIDSYIDLVASSFDSAVVIAADRLDNVTYTSLIQLEGAVINDLNIRARPLPWAIKFVLPRSFPSLWLSQRIFGDGTHNDDLINENKPIHPLFMPPTVIGFCPS